MCKRDFKAKLLKICVSLNLNWLNAVFIVLIHVVTKKLHYISALHMPTPRIPRDDKGPNKKLCAAVVFNP